MSSENNLYIPPIDRDMAKEALQNGSRPMQDFWHALMDSILFKSELSKNLFIRTPQVEEIKNWTATDDNVITPSLLKFAINVLREELKGQEVPEDGNTLAKLRGLIAQLESIVLGASDNNNALDKLTEIKKFLSGITENDQNLLSTLNQKQNIQIGDYKISAQTRDHDGWLLCNGRGLSRSTYSALYNVISTNYGGNSSTFNLPDPRGRNLKIEGSGSGVSSYYSMGSRGGQENMTLSTYHMPSHRHYMENHKHTYFKCGPGGLYAQLRNHYGYVDKAIAWYGDAETSYGGAGYTDYQGSGGSFNLHSPYIAIGHLFIYSGVK